MRKNYLLIAAAGSGMLAVILGAFGAHGLEKALVPQMLQRYHTGVEYQFYHTLALLGAGLLRQYFHQRLLTIAGVAFIIGILLFSGSLYSYVLTGNKAFAIITPVGGLSFIIGWAWLLAASLRLPKPPA